MDLEAIAILGVVGYLLYWLYQQQTVSAAGQLPTLPGATPPAPPIPASSSSIVNTMAAAIAQEEGWNITGSVAQRNNNPGNVGGPTATFATPADGWNQLYTQVNLMLYGGSGVYDPSMTLAAAGLKYSNGDPNWATNVGAIMGIDPNTTTLAQIGAM